jgi:hypothetical protein
MGTVRALTVFDDGGGPALFAGGDFTTAGGVAANRIAKWNGSRWRRLGSGLNGRVFALTVYDDGGGHALYAGGSFTSAGGLSTMQIARWDGSTWSPLGSGITADDGAFVRALALYDDGSGPALYAGGSFTSAGGVAANGIARWDGSSWTPLGSGMRGVRALATFEHPGRGGPSLVAGSASTHLHLFDFEFVLFFDERFIARWQGCPDRTPPVLTCPTSVTVSDPRTGPPGEIVTFTVTASDDRDASPTVVCEPASGSFFPPGTTIVQCKATDGARNQSSCSFPVNVLRKQGQ